VDNARNYHARVARDAARASL